MQPPNLAARLKPAFKRQCGNGCICGGKGICDQKNCVYLIVCRICQKEYCGETSKTLRSRVKAHCPQTSSNVYRHFQREHYKQPSAPDLVISILEFHCINTLHRLAAEKTHINRRHCALNIQLAS